MSQYTAVTVVSNPEQNPQGVYPPQPMSFLALDPPKDNPISRADLAKYDGSDSSGKIYVAVKDYVFDVTKDLADYGPNGRYSIFAGQDASRGLATGSLKTEDLTPLSPDELLSDEQLKALDGSYELFKEQYDIIGRLVD